MSSKMIRQTSFSAGEVDVTTWKRTDIAEYLTAAQSLLNCEIGTTGLAKKRKGTTLRNIATGLATFTSTMYEFVDKNGVYYIILTAPGTFYVFGTPSSATPVVTYQSYYVVDYQGNQVVYDDESVDLIQPITVPYQAVDLFGLDYTQDNDTLILTSPNYPPARIFVSSYSPLTFAFEYLDIYPLPAYDFNQINYNNTTVALSGSDGSSGTTLTIRFTNMPFGAGIPVFNNAWIGGQIIGGGTTELSPVGYGIIKMVTQSTTTVTFTVLVQIAFLVTGASTVGSQYSIRQPAWSGTTTGNPYGLGYPSKVLYFQNRLWLANTGLLPNTIFGSSLNQPISFDVGTGKDTNAIIYAIGQTDSGAVQWLNGGKQLEIFCSNFEFVCPQNEDIGLTPSTFSVRQQSSYGSSTNLKPQTYLNDSYFVQKTGKAAINYHFTGVGLSYTSTNIAPQSQHLMKNPTSRALLRGNDVSQDNFIYLLNDSDSTITAFQFANEIKLAALTPIVFEPNVQLIDIVSVNNKVYILKYYTLTQDFTIESFDQGTYIDTSQDYSMPSSGVITGLNRLEGYKVQVVYANQDFGQYTVVNATITVNNPLLIVATVQIGLLYDVEIKPMYPFYSSTSSPFEKQIGRIYVDYYQSINFYINGKLVQYQSFQDVRLGLPLLPRTDTAIFSPVNMGWETGIALAAISAGATIGKMSQEKEAEKANLSAINQQSKLAALQYQQKNMQNLEATDRILSRQAAQLSTRGVSFSSPSFNAIERETLNIGSKKEANLKTEESLVQQGFDIERKNVRTTLHAQLFGDAASFAFGAAGLAEKWPTAGKLPQVEDL